MHRLLRPLLFLLLLAVALPLALRGDTASSTARTDLLPPIRSSEVLDTRLSASGVRAGACHTRPLTDAAGVVSRTQRVGGLGPITARLDARSGDWDLAVFDARGKMLTAGSGAGSHEIADGWAWTGGVLTIQACRRSGDASRSARVTLEHGTVPQKLIDWAKTQKTKVVDVSTPSRAEKDRLTEAGFDLTEHGGVNSMGVVLHGDADEKRLRDLGFSFRVLEGDLVARSLRERRLDARYAARAQRSPIPSGRTEYRVLADYEDEMKQLADQNKDLVKLIEMPNKTLMDRSVFALEIAENVNVNDGRPVFANMGVHHAREWPSGEHAMEWAIELIKGYKAGDERATKIVRNSRNLVVPIVNPDGFNASRTAGMLGGADGGRDESVEDTAYLVGGAATGGEYRRKNCRLGSAEVANCATSPGAAENGTDPNRNYGGLWGGPGASTLESDQTYRGPGPFSESETKNIQWLLSRHQVMTMITNHTTAGLVLRAPGLLSLGPPIDEERGYKALGDAMALENGYFSQKGYELYDTTGTTEDWHYNAAGGFGFTFEIYCGAPNYETGNCDDPAFHPLFETMVKEWDGSSDQSNHVGDPGRNASNPFGMQKNYDGKGNREAYYIAAESTLNERRHSVLEGDAPAGVTLKLTKAFKNETYPQAQEDEEAPPVPILFDDKLETTMTVPSSGKFRWHINPSTRPIKAKDRGRDAKGKPSPPGTFEQTLAPPTLPCSPFLIGGVCNDDSTFTVPQGPGIDNGKVRLKIEWETQASDYDLKIFRPGASPTSQDTLASSAQRLSNSEEVVIYEPQGEYLIRVANVAGAEPWTGTITYEAPDPFTKGITETWTLTCELNGQVLQTTPVLIDRGQVQRPDLGVCDRRVNEIRNPPPGTTPPGTQPPAACAPVRGFRSVSARRRGRRVALNFSRAEQRPVDVEVFQTSIGRRVIGERLVARYRNRAKSFTWNGRANRRGKKVTDGYYFVRYRMNIGGGRVDVRRITLRRSRGRFVTRPPFYGRDTCGLLRSFKLSRPVFGGRNNRELGIAYRLNTAASVGVVVRRGKRVVRRYAARNRPANQTFRLRLDSERLRRGDHKVTITVRSGTRRETSTLTARRL